MPGSRTKSSQLVCRCRNLPQCLGQGIGSVLVLAEEGADDFLKETTAGMRSIQHLNGRDRAWQGRVLIKLITKLWLAESSEIRSRQHNCYAIGAETRNRDTHTSSERRAWAFWRIACVRSFTACCCSSNTFGSLRCCRRSKICRNG